MRRSRRWFLVSSKAAALVVIFSLSFIPSASAQARLWKKLNTDTLRLYQDGKYREGIRVAKEALRVAEKTFGADHFNVGISLNNLAQLYNKQGKYAKAETLYKRALEIHEKALGPDHPNVGLSLNGLAFLYHAQSHYALAEPLYKRALSIFEKAVPNHPDIATLLENLADLYAKTDRTDEAKKLLDRAKRIRARQ